MEVILCPYCRSRIDEDTILCPTCGEDTTRDAPIEMELEEVMKAERKACRFCGASMLAAALVCPSCRRWQR